MLRKKMLAAVIALMTTLVVGCGDESSVSDSETVAETEIQTETQTEAQTEVQTETETETQTETQTEVQTEAPSSEIITTEETTADTETADVSCTNIELVKMINSAFGIITDGTDEGELKASQDWDIIDKDINPDSEITPEFLISSVMRATGFVSGESDISEIIACALEKGVIDDENLENIDMNNYAEIVQKAKYSWVHQDIDTEIHVELCDGVIDFNGVINVEDITYDGDSIKIPSEYAKDISSGTVFVLPKNPDTGEGGAYKANTVTTDESGFTIIQGVPAEIQEVYKSISSN